MSSGAPAHRLSRLRRLTLVGLLCHAMFLLAAPFEHHDLVCHLKTPQHCPSCVASPAGTRADVTETSGAFRLADAGAVVFRLALSPPARGVHRISGRSPPPIE